MITVKFLGGAKKSFNADKLELDKNNITINELLAHLQKNNLQTNNFDVKNLIVAVNGVDSSALDGYETKLKNGDAISIIPIIHGGSPKRIQFKISNSFIELFDIKTTKRFNEDFLDELREKFPNLTIQAISSDYILGRSHAKKIITISLLAKKNNSLLSKKLETDVLLRFAGTTQIAEAINSLGIKNSSEFIIITIGNETAANKIYNFLKPFLNPAPLSKNNQYFLKKKFNITNKTINSVISETPVEDLLCEKAAILF